MSLRTKFLVLFILLGVVPLLALGFFSYGQGTRALEDLLADRTGAIASRAAETLSQRYARSVSDLMFLGNNAETRRLLETSAPYQDPLDDSARTETLSFLDSAWQAVGATWEWAEIRDADGTVLHRIGEPSTEPEVLEALDRPTGSAEYVVTRPIPGAGDGTEPDIGSIRGSLLLQEVLPRGELEAGFGELGYSVVVDRGGDRVLFHPRLQVRRNPLSSLLGPEGWRLDAEAIEPPTGRFTYTEEEERRLAFFVSLDSPPWTVVSTESLDEFAAPFSRTGSFILVVVLLVTATISTAFLFLTGRATKSLKHLTAAADEVATGNLGPSLPSGGGDEVGRLSTAFSIMVDQVRSMLRRVEESRHMSAIGEFAAQLSHEIRNPLTSIKLNLQRLDRGVMDGRIPQEYAKAVQISLKEANRLDSTVRGVLSISRTRAPRRESESVHEIIRSALDVISPQLEAEEIMVEMEFSAEEDTVLGDREGLKGAFLNLFLNSAEVMDCGGVLRVATNAVAGEGEERPGLDPGPAPGILGRGILIRISDDGPGVPGDVRDKIFDPFFSTKEGGSGFGLALAARVMEEHSGTLTLDDIQSSEPGATFLIVLPLFDTETKNP